MTQPIVVLAGNQTGEAVYDSFATADLAGPTRSDEFTNEVIRRVRTKVEVWSSLA